MLALRPRRPGTGRIRPPARRAAAGLVLAAASVVLAACGAATTAASYHLTPVPAAGRWSPGGGLCAATTALDSLTVTRTGTFPGNRIRFTFPAKVTASDPASVQAVAGALCGLRGPGAPAHGAAIACPISFGVTYHLSFASPGRRFAPVSVAATGCELIRGLAPARWAQGSPLLWRTLGTAVHLPDPGNAAFRGSVPAPARN